MPNITVEDPASPDAQRLMDELSDVLAALTGDPGRSSFDPADVRGPRALFAVARDASSRALGCGAFRPLHPGVAELKRMYAQPGTRGVGGALLAFLEAEATRLGHAELWLSTRAVNTRALGFYAAHGYVPVPNYGHYAGRAASVCLAKRLALATLASPPHPATPRPAP